MENNKKNHVLVVDDEEDLCWVIEKSLRPAGFSVNRALNGKDALLLLEKTFFKVAFVDVKIPDMDGFTLAALIREHSPGTRIVLISGYYYQEDRTIVDGIKDNLFFGFIAKPFNLSEVRRLLYLAISS